MPTADVDAAIARNYDETPAQTNPFLHLSMPCWSISASAASTSHAASRQASNCWPNGLDLRCIDAHHAAMECLGDWTTSADGPPPDGNACPSPRAAPRHAD